MVQTVSTFTKRVPPGAAGAGTLQALMERQKAAAAARESAMGAAEPIQNMWQGAAHIGNIVSAGIREGRADRQESQARGELAKLMSGYDPEKSGSEFFAQVGTYDPELRDKLMQEASEARRAAAEREFTTGERVAGQDFQITKLGEEDKIADTNRTQEDIIADANRIEEARIAQIQASLDAALRVPTVERQKAVEAGLMTPEAKAAADKAEQTKADNDALKAGIGTKYEGMKTGAELGYGGDKENVLFQRDVNSGEWKVVEGAGTKITNTLGGEGESELSKKFSGKEGELWDSYQQEGNRAAGLAQGMEMLDALTAAPQGPLSGRLAEWFPGFSDKAAAFESIVKRYAPTQREPGSGSTSDIEYAGMLASLPQLKNNPEANALISEMVKAQANIAMQRSAIVSKWANSDRGQVAGAEARDALQKINAQSIMNPKLDALIRAANEATPGGITGIGALDTGIDAATNFFTGGGQGAGPVPPAAAAAAEAAAAPPAGTPPAAAPPPAGTPPAAAAAPDEVPAGPDGAPVYNSATDHEGDTLNGGEWIVRGGRWVKAR